MPPKKKNTTSTQDITTPSPKMSKKQKGKPFAPSSSRNFSSEFESEIQEFHDEENYNVEE